MKTLFFWRSSRYLCGMGLGRAAQRVLGTVSAILVLFASHLLAVNLNIPDLRGSSAATEHSTHGALAQHLGKTMPHAHGRGDSQASSHHHSHGVPAPDETTPGSRAVPDALEVLATILLSMALVGTIFWRAVLLSETAQRVSPGLLAYSGTMASCTALIRALVLAPQAPPALAS